MYSLPISQAQIQMLIYDGNEGFSSMEQSNVDTQSSLLTHCYYRIWIGMLFEIFIIYYVEKSSTASFTEDLIDTEQCHHENESIDICNEWNPCMSITRLNDGFNNCHNEEDESKQLEIDLSKSCSHISRFRCSITQVTCLSVMVLGNVEQGLC